MATELHVRIRPNPYRGHEAVFWWNGMLNRYSFELRTELAIKLVDDCVPQRVIDSVMDSLDVFEWDQPEYPLGVVWVGEAVCDSPVDEPVPLDCDCAICRQGYNAQAMSDLRSVVRSQWWFTGFALLVIGVVAFFV